MGHCIVILTVLHDFMQVPGTAIADACLGANGLRGWQVSMTATFVLDSKLLTECHITRNLCAHRWLTQLAPHGSPHEFREYWDSLGKERQQAGEVNLHSILLELTIQLQKYDAKATKLVSGY
jgi:hypothetical protein